MKKTKILAEDFNGKSQKLGESNEYYKPSVSTKKK